MHSFHSFLTFPLALVHDGRSEPFCGFPFIAIALIGALLIIPKFIPQMWNKRRGLLILVLWIAGIVTLVRLHSFYFGYP